MYTPNKGNKNKTLGKDMHHDEIKELQMHILRLEEEAARKDKQISQLMSRMREYEMGEYGLAEAVGEIKDCRKLIRARDREVENLTDEINLLKLQVTELTEKNTNEPSKSIELTSFLDSKQCSTKEKKMEKEKISYLNKTSQCYFPAFPSQYLEDIYAIEVQNEKLRHELSEVCETAIDLSVQLQNLNKQDEVKNEISVCEIEQSLLKLTATAKKSKFIMKNLSQYSETQDCNLKLSDDCYEAVLQYIKKEDVNIQEIFHELSRQISVLKNNQGILIRRYIIMSEREAILRKENTRLRKTIHINWRKTSDSSNIAESELNQGITAKYLSSDDAHFLQKLKEKSDSTCKNLLCQENYARLINITMKLLTEIPLLRKLLDISHHQTQAMEAMCFSHEIELKALRDQLALFQAQSDEKMLLGKLAMKVLQLQFNQAECVYELKKCKVNHQTLQDWYLSLKAEYQENGKKFATLYLEAQDKVKHLRDVLKDLCQRCSEALSSYISPDYKSL